MRRIYHLFSSIPHKDHTYNFVPPAVKLHLYAHSLPLELLHNSNNQGHWRNSPPYHFKHEQFQTNSCETSLKNSENTYDYIYIDICYKKLI